MLRQEAAGGLTHRTRSDEAAQFPFLLTDEFGFQFFRRLEFPHIERTLSVTMPLHRPEQMIKWRFDHAPIFAAAEFSHSCVNLFHKLIFVCGPSRPHPFLASQNEHNHES